jgi:hypothetical protein
MNALTRRPKGRVGAMMQINAGSIACSQYLPRNRIEVMKEAAMSSDASDALFLHITALLIAFAIFVFVAIRNARSTPISIDDWKYSIIATPIVMMVLIFYYIFIYGTYMFMRGT